VQSWNAARDGWLNPFGVSNVGTVLAQFAVVLVGLLLLNRWMAARTEMVREE
jgi:hypothetical protein